MSTLYIGALVLVLCLSSGVASDPEGRHGFSAEVRTNIDSGNIQIIKPDESRNRNYNGSVAIIRQIQKLNKDGSYALGYEAEDGTFKIETKDVLGNVKGTFGYVAPNGEIKRLSYIANESNDKKSKQQAQVNFTTLPPKANAQSQGHTGTQINKPFLYSHSLPRTTKAPASAASLVFATSIPTPTVYKNPKNGSIYSERFKQLSTRQPFKSNSNATETVTIDTKHSHGNVIQRPPDQDVPMISAHSLNYRPFLVSSQKAPLLVTTAKNRLQQFRNNYEVAEAADDSRNNINLATVYTPVFNKPKKPQETELYGAQDFLQPIRTHHQATRQTLNKDIYGTPLNSQSERITPNPQNHRLYYSDVQPIVPQIPNPISAQHSPVQHFTPVPYPVPYQSYQQPNEMPATIRDFEKLLYLLIFRYYMGRGRLGSSGACEAPFASNRYPISYEQQPMERASKQVFNPYHNERYFDAFPKESQLNTEHVAPHSEGLPGDIREQLLYKMLMLALRMDTSSPLNKFMEVLPYSQNDQTNLAQHPSRERQSNPRRPPVKSIQILGEEF